MGEETVLITGGAGFIGSFVADELLREGYRVRVLDSLSKQVHGSNRGAPEYLDERVDLRIGDIRDQDQIRDCLKGVNSVVHLAAAVGVGQSMYEIAHYTSTNNLGTAVLLQALIDQPVERLVVASSMSLYGEGRYELPSGRAYDDAGRSPEELKKREWDPQSPEGEELHPIPTPEEKRPSLASIYALSKFDQEQMSLVFGRAYDVPVVALRLFNVYGPRQALSNPYTGVIAIFASRLLNDEPPLVYEDGEQRRDFVNVGDVARAFRLALEAHGVDNDIVNIGSGTSRSINDVARALASALGKHEIQPEITERGRVGDVRHCFADITRARELLGFEPRVSFSEGVDELVEWLINQRAEDRIETADAELRRRGLTY